MSAWLASLVKDKVVLVTRLGLVLYAVESMLYLALGQLNADEGWYLYGSKLVFQGLLPYRDFAYTQMPLLPYIYGVPQIVSPGLVTGRLTCIAISLGTLGMGVVIARRAAGSRAGAITALLFAAFTFGIYFSSIVKTYSLVSFFFVATLFVLSSRLDEVRKYPLALLYAFAAAFVRITAVLFTVPILIYAWRNATRQSTRVWIALESALAGLTAAFFILSDWTSARWDLFDSHLRHWAGAQASTQINAILSMRLPDIIQHFGLAILLFAGTAYFLIRSKGIRTLLSGNGSLWIALLGLVLFAIAHLVNGLWDVEYLVPAMLGFLPALAIVLTWAYDELEKQARVLAQGTFVAVLVLFPLSESISHIDWTGRRLPLAEVNSVATVIAQNSQPEDKILALEALGSVLQAHRSTLPGMTLAQFSAQLMDAPTARRLHLVNAAILADAVNRQAAKVVILTESDWSMLLSYDAASAERLRLALDERYRLASSMPLFGEYARIVSVYVSR